MTNQDARTIIITGASDGIGAAAARQIARNGDRLVLVGRSPEKTAAIAEELGAPYYTADFANLSQVRDLASQLRAAYPKIDVLANNAGGIFGKQERTADGFEKIFQVNYLAPFLLTSLLLEQLEAGEGVVINTASSAAKNYGRIDLADLQNERKYSVNKAYGDAKLGNILFTRGLRARFAAAGIHTVSFDPGNIATNFASDTASFFRFVYTSFLSKLVLERPEKGGDNLAFFIQGTPGETWQEGAFYTKQTLATERQTNPQVHDDALVDALWKQTEQLLAATRR
jgi:NAD(P)-dependent dehydrogenase (short-subunit alcohol dehydrogenase family)